MFDIFAHLLSSIASFLFPLFASYKALKTSDPAQLTPWLMYWVVLACALLVESWTEWILVWIPFYAYIRFLFLLYLVLPQTQGARIIYQTHVHPFLQDNEAQIEEFISDAHDRLKAAGIAYLKRAIELIKTNVLGLPPGDPEPAAQPAAAAASSAPTQTYTQSLLARFSVPTARWAPAGHAGSDFYNLLAGAVSAATNAAAGGGAPGQHQDLSKSGSIIPPELKGGERMSFIAAQRERLAFLLKALDREAAASETAEGPGRPGSMQLDGGGEEEVTQRPASAHSGLSKSRSETDFEKIDAESGAEDLDDNDEDGTVRRRQTSGGSSWVPWGWGATPTAENPESGGSSSGVQK
ncbi:HVA22 family TB2/DP1 protein [Colletotrichum caudatum]|nr:HVA22 family TB2/DP1 protein [Colletotrichum caudatum]